MNRQRELGALAVVLVVALGIAIFVIVRGSDDVPADETARCESWVEKVESGEAELTREQEVVIRSTLVVGEDAASALSFEATPMCEAAAGFELVGTDGSLTPMALYIAYECGVAPQEGKSVCEQLEQATLRIGELAERE